MLKEKYNIIELCDTSHWNKDDIISIAMAQDNNIILKATQGVNYIDSELYKRFLGVLANSNENTVFIGLYHYLDKNFSGSIQALFFYSIYEKLCKIAQKVNIKLVPILDYEELNSLDKYNDFYDKWYKLTSTSLVTYTNVSFINQYQLDFTNRLLWLAGWTHNEKTIISRLDKYPNCILYQYTDKYTFISGSYTDRNYLLINRFKKKFYYKVV